MTGQNMGSRRQWVLLSLVFLLGLLIGWWVIGYWLWPIQYTNALPQDLVASAKEEYLMSTADAYALTGDIGPVNRRITAYAWPKDQLARDLNALQTRLSIENPVQAQNVQRLAVALGAAGQGAATPTAGATPVASQSPSLLARLCPGGLWLLLILAGIAALAWLWQRWRQTQGGGFPPGGRSAVGQWTRHPTATPAMQPDPLTVPLPYDQDETRSAAPPPAWQLVDPDRGQTKEDGGYDTAAYGDEKDLSAGEDLPAAGLAAGSQPSRPAFVAAPAGRQEGAPAAGAATGTERLLQIGEFTAVYHAGEPDYDEAFDIKDAQGAVVGQCGLSLMLPVGRGNDQAAALQVWLWEERDQYTQVKVLMSEGAYRDTGLRSQLAEENPAAQVRPGAEFYMDSHTLRLHGIVDRVSYLEGEPYHQMFELMAVRLQVFQKDRV